MKTSAALLFGALAVAGTPPLPAQTAGSDITPVLETAPRTLPPAPTDRPRLLSPETASRLALNRPAFVPKAEPAPESTPPPDARETDKPRNGIIRLPPHIVRELKIPAFKERELLTPKGKLELAYKRHPGLRFGNLPFFSNNAIAMFMLEEEYRLERIAEMSDLVGMMSLTDPASAKVLKAGAARGFLRSNEWISSGGSHGLQRAK
ncbi:MAG TPA: hypothetical protein VHO24_21375 [Opitutaceae bacterium]|nr:hypothetical protein [Opitutaceae bacterium]